MFFPQGTWSLGKEAGQVTLRRNLASKMITSWEGVKYEHCVSHQYLQSIMKSSFLPFPFSLVHMQHNSGGWTPPAGRLALLSWRAFCLWSLWTIEHQLRDGLGQSTGNQAWHVCSLHWGQVLICRPWSSRDQRVTSLCSPYPLEQNNYPGGENPAGGILV